MSVFFFFFFDSEQRSFRENEAPEGFYIWTPAILLMNKINSPDNILTWKVGEIRALKLCPVFLKAYLPLIADGWYALQPTNKVVQLMKGTSPAFKALSCTLIIIPLLLVCFESDHWLMIPRNVLRYQITLASADTRDKNRKIKDSPSGGLSSRDDVWIINNEQVKGGRLEGGLSIISSPCWTRSTVALRSPEEPRLPPRPGESRISEQFAPDWSWYHLELPLFASWNMSVMEIILTLFFFFWEMSSLFHRVIRFHEKR